MVSKNSAHFRILFNKKLNICFVFLLIIHRASSGVVSYNIPKFCPMVSWTPHAVTLTNDLNMTQELFSIFVHKNNMMFVGTQRNGLISVNLEHNISTWNVLSKNLSNIWSVFVSSDDALYVYGICNNCSLAQEFRANVRNPIVKRGADSGDIWCCFLFSIYCNWYDNCPWLFHPVYYRNSQTGNQTNNSTQLNFIINVNEKIYRWLSNTTVGMISMHTNGTCFSLFVDINNTLYCSMTYHHKIVKACMEAETGMITVAAGTGENGSTSNTLNYPWGIFVNINFDLYVADSLNNRIQRFTPGNSTGITVAGSSAKETIDLNRPTGITLDVDNNLFIVDSDNHRIIGSAPHGFHCLIGCSKRNGTAADMLFNPTTLSFDSHGNILVVDNGNNRIQKFHLATNSCKLSYNQPKFCPFMAWNPAGITVAKSEIIGDEPYGLFVDATNTIHVTNNKENRLHTWIIENDTIILYKNATSSSKPYSMFVTLNGDIFVDNGKNGSIVPFSVNRTKRISLQNINKSCYGLFVDHNNTIYCSIKDKHKVVKKSLDSINETLIDAAGNGSNGSSANQLNEPYGIFVDESFDLYVTDCLNNRIQRFRPGESKGITVAGNELATTTKLHFPTDVTVDGENRLFIVDSCNHRIVRSTGNDLRCVVGCSKNPGSEPNELQYPAQLAFNSYGDLFVSDMGNNRIQKFTFKQSSCLDPPLPHLLATVCEDYTPFGIPCSKLNSICKMTDPCLNNGICIDNHTTPTGYTCACLFGFNGVKCENDSRLCEPNPCWNNGTCESLEITFQCNCSEGWTGQYCEIKINFCDNITCENNGVCRPLLRNYTCECLGDSYTGRHCENVAIKIKIYKFVSKSFAYVAILAMVSAMIFIVIMDILKYGFGIDPVDEERQRIRRKKQLKKRKPVIQRFVYVNAPTTTTNQETTV